MATITLLHPERAPAPLLQVDGVSLEYRTPERVVRATERVSFELHAAERLVLLGPSGCGKSTLLQAIAGFIAPREGEIRLAGRPVRAPGPDRALVFAEPDQLAGWKTVRDNVAFPLLASRSLGPREAHERALHWLHELGLAGCADAYPHQLPVGTLLRVAIARALALQPRVLLMDDPFAGLAAPDGHRLREDLLRLWEEARFALVFATAAADEALVLGSRIGVLSRHPGRLRAEIHNEHSGAAIDSTAFQLALRRVQYVLFNEAPEGAGALPGRRTA